MKNSLLLTCIVFASLAAAAQSTVPKGNGHVSGIVIDSITQIPVEFANVTLLDTSTNHLIDGTVCDGKGKFSITKLPKGNYQVSISFIGYETKTIPITISDKKNEIDLGSVQISVAAKLLEEITVQGQKVLVEEKVDRTLYNAENDLTTKGGDATDVLKRVPLLSVDMDGNVSLRGSSSVKVLINNKPSTITAISVADALKQIPADMIKTVEVITSPSSKYDAEGSAGIINIITKKNTLEGVFFTGDGGVGTRGSNLSLNGNYRKGKMGLSLGAFTRATYNVFSDYVNNQTTMSNGDTVLSIQTAHLRSQGTTSQLTFGWDYDINKLNSLTASVRYGAQNQSNYQDQLYTQTFQQDILQSTSLKNVKATNAGRNADASITYTKLFARKGREFDFLGIYSRNSPTTGFVTNTFSPSDNSLLSSYKNDNQGKTDEITLQIDFVEPIKENQTLEFGAKDFIRNVSSGYQNLVAQGINGEYVPATKPSSNSFTYNQTVSAGYLSYSISTANNYTIKAGGRYEYTTILSHFQNQQDIKIPSYGVLVPSVNVSRKLKNGNLLKVSYNRRIQRPSLRDLNPNLQSSNPINVTIGNPLLKPEYADNFEIAYKTFIKSTSINLSTYLRNNTNDIQPARTVRHDTIVSVYQNIGTEANYGVSFFASVPVSSNFSINAGLDMYYRILKNNSNDSFINATNQGLVTNVRVFGNYNFSKGWALQFFSFFQGRNINLQGYRTNPISHSIALKKDILRKKGSVGFGLDNFATPSYKVYTKLESAYLLQSTTTTLHNFIARVNFSYKIGKLSPEKKKGRSSDEEE